MTFPVIIPLPPPPRVVVPLLQHAGKICEPVVAVGQRVKRGERVGISDAVISTSVHAPIAGTVAAIEERPHPQSGMSPAVVIDGDGSDSAVAFVARTPDEAAALTPAQLRALVHEAGIVGLGGAAFPSHVKLAPPGQITTLIVNGVECEPLLDADNALMVHKHNEIAAGMALVARAIGATRVVVAIEDNKPAAIKAFRGVRRRHRFDVLVLPKRYPQGGEKQLVKTVTGKECGSGILPCAVGSLVHNVATLFAIYEAVYLGKPLYERVVTVAGDCLEKPKDFLVRIGTPLADVIAACGPLRCEPKKVVFGGPMMGVAQSRIDVPVIKSTNGILLLSGPGTPAAEDAACIRCARCVQQCPMGLMSCMISMAVEKGRWDLAEQYGSKECIECGLCDYVCPQRRRLVPAIKRAKVRKT